VEVGVTKALVVDADASLRVRVADGLARAGASVEVVGDAQVALAVLGVSAPDVAVVGLDSPALDGLQLIHHARTLVPGVRLVAMSGLPASPRSRRLADDLLLVPWVDGSFARILEGVTSRLTPVPPDPASDDSGDPFDRVVGAHPSMQRLLQKANQAALSKSTVLITGETGAGKEGIAAWIHRQSPRRHKPYVRLNCSALAETVIESELFGHERGAFTGAAARRIGRFEQAAGGTLFLDEVSEIPPAVQVKLLGVLQERRFERVGGNETVLVDVRIVAATNRDLRAAVEAGRFREDLFYRLNVIQLEVPPLRTRVSDIPILAAHFLRRFADGEGKHLDGFSDDALQALMASAWPGNVRELENAIEQAVVLATGSQVEVADLPLPSSPGIDAFGSVKTIAAGMTLAELERIVILKTLEAYGGSTAEAGRVLGISRRKIQYRLRQWGLLGHGRTTVEGA
jgi:DNA-binding NtrC family response regulator